MTEYSEKDLNFALDAIQDPEIRKSEEFKQWLTKEENRQLLIELMAGKEAIMRENHLKKNKLKKQIRIISIISIFFTSLHLRKQTGIFNFLQPAQT